MQKKHKNTLYLLANLDLDAPKRENWGTEKQLLSLSGSGSLKKSDHLSSTRHYLSVLVTKDYMVFGQHGWKTLLTTTLPESSGKESLTANFVPYSNMATWVLYPRAEAIFLLGLWGLREKAPRL